ncbi:MAG: hypothetical protein ACD_46C00720G0003 [uncultured bacterium]|nr:MAG: hypothetical protein ACD_46C00720G0003 [uncultured bacterium]
MQINFVGKNIEITPAIKTYITDKFSHIEKRFNRITQTHIVLHVENIDQIAEATLYFDGIEMHAAAKSHDMYQSIDMLVDKLTGQMTKHKEKIIDQHR